MQKKVFGIIHFLIILAVISMGLPRYMVGDLNRDHAVDLADAVIGAKNLVQTAEKPSVFVQNIKQAVSAIQLAAGLKTKIQADNGKSTSQDSDQNFLISATAAPFNPTTIDSVSDSPSPHRTASPLPQIPPPRLS